MLGTHTHTHTHTHTQKQNNNNKNLSQLKIGLLPCGTVTLYTQQAPGDKTEVWQDIYELAMDFKCSLHLYRFIRMESEITSNDGMHVLKKRGGSF
jgi:hypothetical protein